MDLFNMFFGRGGGGGGGGEDGEEDDEDDLPSFFRMPGASKGNKSQKWVFPGNLINKISMRAIGFKVLN